MTVWNSSNNIGGAVRVDGLAELQKAMKELPAAVERNLMRGALRAAATVIADEARLRVPVDTGQLKASIRVSTRLENGKPKAFVKAGARYVVYEKKGKSTKNPYRTQRASGKIDYHAAFYAFWIEFGTVKMRARPFMRPAFEGKLQSAYEVAANYIRTRLPKEVAKLKGGKP